MKIRILILFCFFPLPFYAQIFDSNSAQSVLNAQSAYVQAYGQMTQRAIQIMHTVQPYREAMYQKARNGEYENALRILIDVEERYIYYVFDNRVYSRHVEVGGEIVHVI